MYLKEEELQTTPPYVFVPTEAYYCWEVEADTGWKYNILPYRNIKMYTDTTEFNLAEHITASAGVTPSRISMC